MERPEVPLEQSQEEIAHHAHAAAERWIMGVALTAAFLAVMAAIAALLAEHHANEAMLDRIKSSDHWSYYQAKSIKANLFATKIDLLAALNKTVDQKDRDKVEQYRKEQDAVKDDAVEEEHASESHLRRHTTLSFAVTLFQIGIAVGAISVLTKRKSFWGGSIAFGVAGLVMLVWAMLVG
jgi:ribosome-binding ATPase YchF (GTP1/OBG family)